MRLSLFAIICVLAGASTAPAQGKQPAAPGAPLPEVKELAKAERAAALAKLADVAAAKLAVAKVLAEARLKEFHFGKTTIDFLVASNQARLDAALAVRPEDRLAILAGRWELAVILDEVLRAKFNAGNIPVTQALEGAYHRLSLEEELLSTFGAQGKAVAPAGVAMDDFGAELRTARALAALRGKTPAEAAKAKRDTVHVGLEARWQEFVVGKTTADFLMRWAQRLAADEPAAAWHFTFLAEEVNRAKYEAGNLAVTQLAQVVYEHQRVSWLWRKGGANLPAGGSLPPLFDTDPTVAVTVARAQRKLTQATPEQLLRAAAAAADTQVVARTREYLAGKTTGEFLAAIAQRRDAWLALATTPAARAAVLRDAWDAAWSAEWVGRQKYDHGNLSTTEYAVTLYRRLHAEWLLLRDQER
jgi:hypothetical protein